jgi:putative transposase
LVSFIDEHKDRTDGGRRWGVESICRVLRAQGLPVAPATYYAAKNRPLSPRAVRDEQLKTVMAQVHAENYGVYGARKLQAALRRDRGIGIGRDQTARLMRELGLQGVRRGKPKRTTIPDEPPTDRSISLTDASTPTDQTPCGWLTDLHPHLGRLRLPRSGDRRVQPPRYRLGVSHAHAH